MNARVFVLMRGLLVRFRWEIAAATLVSTTASIWAAVDMEGMPVVAFRWLEVALFGWLGLRLALAESGFGTHGGWEARPFRRHEPFVAQLAVWLLVLLLPLAMRAMCVAAVLSPSAEGWAWVLRKAWL